MCVMSRLKKFINILNLFLKIIFNKKKQKTALEAEAYSEYMEACYNFEVEKWK